MGIRLNKVTKECNVGLQTAVEFLQKKGFTDIEANPNTKITEEQYEMLVAAFKTDQGLRKDAELISRQRQNKEKKETISIAEEEVTSAHPAAAAPTRCEGNETYESIPDRLFASQWSAKGCGKYPEGCC